MNVTFEIEAKGDLTPVMVAHNIGNNIGLPFEVVGTGNDDEWVQLTIEIQQDQIYVDGTVAEPFNDEILTLASYIKISSYREKVFTALESVGTNGLMPHEIANETSIIQNHVSSVLKQLKDKGLIVCINPEVHKGRIYRLTNKGLAVGGVL